MVTDKLQKRFGNICRNFFVERWAEPNNITFYISGCLLWIGFWFFRFTLLNRRASSYLTFAYSKMVSFDEFFDSRLFIIDSGSCLKMFTGWLEDMCTYCKRSLGFL